MTVLGASPCDSKWVLDAVEKGVKVRISADTTSINGGNIFTAMRFVLQDARSKEQHRIRAAQEPMPFEFKYNSADAFRLATLGGAEALGLSSSIGTVEVGKNADLLIFDATSVNLAGADDPFSGVVFLAASEDIETVLVDGEIVKNNHSLVREWAPIAKKLKQTAAGIRRRCPAGILELEAVAQRKQRIRSSRRIREQHMCV